MSIIVKVGEAKTHLFDLLARVEAGEEVIITRGNEPIAKLTRIRHAANVDAIIDQIELSRANRLKTTADEIRAWRDEDRRP